MVYAKSVKPPPLAEVIKYPPMAKLDHIILRVWPIYVNKTYVGMWLNIEHNNGRTSI